MESHAPEPRTPRARWCCDREVDAHHLSESLLDPQVVHEAGVSLVSSQYVQRATRRTGSRNIRTFAHWQLAAHCWSRTDVRAPHYNALLRMYNYAESHQQQWKARAPSSHAIGVT